MYTQESPQQTISPSAVGLQATPDLQELSELGDMSEVPDKPELPDLPDLPITQPIDISAILAAQPQ
jgi:hypothetical protein